MFSCSWILSFPSGVCCQSLCFLRIALLHTEPGAVNSQCAVKSWLCVAYIRELPQSHRDMHCSSILWHESKQTNSNNKWKRNLRHHGIEMRASWDWNDFNQEIQGGDGGWEWFLCRCWRHTLLCVEVNKRLWRWGYPDSSRMQPLFSISLHLYHWFISTTAVTVNVLHPALGLCCCFLRIFTSKVPTRKPIIGFLALQYHRIWLGTPIG